MEVALGAMWEGLNETNGTNDNLQNKMTLTASDIYSGSNSSLGSF